jgi:hypothetical protein
MIAIVKLLKLGTLDAVASLLPVTLYLLNHDMNHKLWNFVSTERYILYMQIFVSYKWKFTMGMLKSSFWS